MYWMRRKDFPREIGLSSWRRSKVRTLPRPGEEREPFRFRGILNKRPVQALACAACGQERILEDLAPRSVMEVVLHRASLYQRRDLMKAGLLKDKSRGMFSSDCQKASAGPCYSAYVWNEEVLNQAVAVGILSF